MTKDINYYNTLPYKVELEYNHQDNTWTAFHPELGKAACYAIAETKQDALSELNDDRHGLLEILLAEGSKIPEPSIQEEDLSSGHLALRIPKSLHYRLKQEAKTEGTSINQFVSNLISHYIGYRQTVNKFDVIISNIKFDQTIQQAANMMAISLPKYIEDPIAKTISFGSPKREMEFLKDYQISEVDWAKQ